LDNAPSNAGTKHFRLTAPFGRFAGEESLKKAELRYRALTEQGEWPLLEPSSTDAEVRQRLNIENPDLACEELTDCLQLAQRRYGLPPTGILDYLTLKALNVPVDVRLTSIVSNLERWRWFPDTIPSTTLAEV
jgi:murein L,D-transpeptidase YcbB/YkuD